MPPGRTEDDPIGSGTSRLARTILHVDMDAFYVSVELLHRPELRGRPVVVGGTGERGVIAAASYEARRYGIRSAMSSVQARRRCPDLVFLPGDHARYAIVSSEIMQVLHDVSPLVEPIALDEAFVDVTGAVRRLGPGATIADRVRRRIREVTGLPCSVGVASNKLVAKLASEAAKPRIVDGNVVAGTGVFEVLPGEELAFIHPLPVEALWGVGPVTLDRLNSVGVRTIGDLASIDERALVHLLGKANGGHLAALARGLDARPVESDRTPRSIGHEETFAVDLRSVAEVHRQVVRLADAVAGRLRAQGRAARTVSLKVRHGDFSTWARSVTPGRPLDTGPEIVAALVPILDDVAGSLAERGVRLVGVSGSNLVVPHRQLSLDDVVPVDRDASTHRQRHDWDGVSEAIDAIRERFGGGAIRPASSVEPRPGERPWGPDAT